MADLMKQIDIGKSAWLAVLITASLWLVDFVMKMLNIPVEQLFAIQAINPVTTTIGGKVLGILGGIIPNFDLPSLAVVWFSALLIVIVGGVIMNTLPGLPKGRVAWQQIFFQIIYGTLVFYLVIVGPMMKAWQALVGLAIYTAIVAYVTAFLAKTVRI